MAPFSLLTASVSWLAKSFSVLHCSSALASRCTSVLPVTHIIPLKCLTSQASGPPKRPLNGYMRFVQQQQPIVTRQYPEFKSVDIMRKIAEHWRTLNPEKKQPFEEASLRAWEQFTVDLQRYQAQLTPAQVQQQAQEKRERMAKRKAIRKKRELTKLGKPKRPRIPFNIYMSEHFEDAKGTTTQEKMKSLLEEWRSLLGNQKKVYMQLAEDDKIRYKNEMKSWEDHMVEIGREDLIRERTLSVRKIKPTVVKKVTKKAKTKVAVKKVTATGKKNPTRKTRTKETSSGFIY